MIPRIAIPIPTTADRAYNDLNWPAYAEAVRSCGGEPQAISCDAKLSAVRGLMAECSGILLPGSPADVDPARYGQVREEETAARDEGRETIDTVLMEHAWESGTPLLAICFGMQMLNVWLGGTLVQDLMPLPVNHPAGRSVAVAHSVEILPGSLLAELAGRDDATGGASRLRVGVNSSHHQAVGVPGRGLRVTARCPEDRVVEAVELSNGSRFMLAVQWHPERTVSSSVTSRNIFARFIKSARDGRPLLLSGVSAAL